MRPGGLLEARLAVLDDISRAPGEALHVLFRILHERRFALDREEVPRPEDVSVSEVCGTLWHASGRR